MRAAEGRGFKADNMIAVGIGGSDSAINEFKKPNPTGFFGTVLISPKRHGYETSVDMYEWITQNKEPAKLTLTSGCADGARHLSGRSQADGSRVTAVGA